MVSQTFACARRCLCLIRIIRNSFETGNEKTVFGVFDQVQHKLGCGTATEDGWRLESSNPGRRGIMLSFEKNKDTYHLCDYRLSDLRLLLSHMQTSDFLKTRFIYSVPLLELSRTSFDFDCDNYQFARKMQNT